MAANLYNQQDKNVFKTWLLMLAFIILVSGLGWAMSYVFESIIVFYLAIGFSLAMNIYAYWNSDKVAIRQARAQTATENQYPDLHNLVENLAITAGLPKPKLYIIPDSSPNAFATGRNPENSAIAVTQGLLDNLDRTEIEGVIAHEMAHIGNRDILVMTIAVVLAGFIALAADWLLRGFAFGSSDNRGGGVQILIAIGISLFASLFATLLQLAISRRREYLADATGALLTRYPEGLASALEKIASSPRPLKTASKATAHLYISQPFGAAKRLSGLFATHPPMERRIAALRGLEV
jgi:heat shock protein HtpX